jgi:HSP20 family protein
MKNHQELHKFIDNNMKNTNNEFEINIPSISSNSLFNDDIEHRILSPLSCLREYGMFWLLEFDLPLVNKKNIKITFDEKSIYVEAKLKETYSEKKLGTTMNFEYFKKTITLPDDIDKKNVSARFENGRLQIKFPRIISRRKIKIE